MKQRMKLSRLPGPHSSTSKSATRFCPGAAVSSEKSRVEHIRCRVVLPQSGQFVGACRDREAMSPHIRSCCTVKARLADCASLEVKDAHAAPLT
eukprot:s1645_g19.t1